MRASLHLVFLAVAASAASAHAEPPARETPTGRIPDPLAIQSDDWTATRTLERNALLKLLYSKRHFPPARAFLRLGKAPDTARHLSLIASDAKLEPHVRLNAIRSLEYFASQHVEDTLFQFVYEKRMGLPYRRAALRALARGFGVKVYFEILPFVRDTDPAMRAAGAMAFAELDDERVRGILETHLANESNIHVRDALEAAIAYRDRQERAPRAPSLPRPTNR